MGVGKEKWQQGRPAHRLMNIGSATFCCYYPCLRLLTPGRKIQALTAVLNQDTKVEVLRLWSPSSADQLLSLGKLLYF